MRCLPVIYAAALAGCFSKPARPNESCGDAVLDDGETCEDGNQIAGDGCSPSCAIEPWFECPTVGEACHPIIALRWTQPSTTLPFLGNGGGVGFELDCGTLAGINGPNTVIVGLQGETEASSASSLFGLQAHCADIELVADGSIHWETTQLTTPAQGTSGAGGLGLEVRSCDPDEVVTGFDGNSNDAEMSSVELFCQAIKHEGGKLSLGAPRRLAKLGPGVHTEQPEAACEGRDVTRAMVGRAGAIIDSFSLRCAKTDTVVCGDGQTTSPFETCDDGNAIPGDGCNARCNGD